MSERTEKIRQVIDERFDERGQADLIRKFLDDQVARLVEVGGFDDDIVRTALLGTALQWVLDHDGVAGLVWWLQATAVQLAADEEEKTAPVVGHA